MIENGNIFAAFMLAIWPVVTLMLFSKTDMQRALIWTVLAAYMFLPPATGFDFPVIPPLTKDTIPPIAALLTVLFVQGKRIALLPDSLIGKILIPLFIFSPIATVISNGDPIAVAMGVTLPGLRLYDLLSICMAQAITLIPFVMARSILGDENGMRAILKALVAAGLIYSLPMLYEARMSPQLNTMIYGYFQHEFAQAIRFGGFRPFVFMPHGLWVAFFAFMSVAAAAAMLRMAPAAERARRMMVLGYLCIILILCRSFGPLGYGLAIVPMILFAPPRLQLLAAIAMVAVVIGYPLLRGSNVIPVEKLIQWASALDPDRGQSLAFRLMNEELFLMKTALKPWFGWGTFGRNFLYDPITGQHSVVADGGWILTLGLFGWVGYVAEFGLLILPIIALWRAGGKGGRHSQTATAIAMILAANLFDLLPNDTQIPFTWLMAGAILGYAERAAAGKLRAEAGNSENMPPVEIKKKRTIL